MSRLRILLSALLVVVSLSGCGVGNESNAEEQTVSSQTEALKKGKDCLDGEVRHCTLGPPPVCTCVAK